MSQIRMSGFQEIPPVIKNLIIVNALLFFAQTIFQNNPTLRIEEFLALHDVHSAFFRPHQLITYMFLHANIGHIFWNMLLLWVFGSMLENVWGSKRFLVFYVLSGIGAAVLHLAVLYFEMEPVMAQFRMLPPEQQAELIENPLFRVNTATLGASGAVFGCMAAFGYLFPNSILYIYFLFPIKAKWLVIIYIVMELWLGVRNTAGDNIAHWAHLGGGLAGFLLVLYWNRTNRRNFY